MSTAILERLTALLGPACVGRDPSGLPRAMPDSSDAAALVLRLAHDEGWKVRLEGRGSWLPADAPADLALSSRGLDQVVSVSPADLVATVQAGVTLDTLERRLSAAGMWLPLDPPG
ncbi:MAG TPA: FAD-binding protein, partial [Gemmatimonadales bacterium]|nr:FAD-binding protein [Gemmatimonadales bacterium]